MALVKSKVRLPFFVPYTQNLPSKIPVPFFKARFEVDAASAKRIANTEGIDEGG